METLYPSYCEKFGWMMDENALSSMKAANAAKLAELDAKIKDAEENLGDVEVRDAMLAKAEFYAGTADRCLLYTSPSPRDATLSRMPSSA